MNKRWIRLASAGALTAGMAAGWVGGITPAHAAGSLTTTGWNCANPDVNPTTTLNALTIQPDTTRKWDEISSATIATGVDSVSTSLGSIPEAKVTVNLCAAPPSFPDPATGDAGAEWITCFQPSGEPLTTAPNGIQIGTAADGAPIYDGPYESNQGWEFCGWASMTAGQPNDWGVAFFDPIGQFTFLDRANLIDSNLTSPTVTSATGFGTATITYDIPYSWISSAQAVDTLTQTVKTVTTSDPVIAAGTTINNPVTQGQANVSVGLPTLVCTPVVVNCFQSLAGLLTTTSWAPYGETCATPIIGCSKAAGSGYDIGLSPIGFPFEAFQTIINPLNPCLGTAGLCIAHQEAAGPPPSSYSFVYGRIIPGPVPGSGALDSTGVPYTLTAQFLPYGGSVAS